MKSAAIMLFLIVLCYNLFWMCFGWDEYKTLYNFEDPKISVLAWIYAAMGLTFLMVGVL